MVFDYVSGGLGHIYDLHTFFIYTKIDGCTLTCVYGAVCGTPGIAEANIPDPTLSSISAPHTNTSPMQVTASNSFIPGYGPVNVCLECSANNALTLSPFQSTISIQQKQLDCTDFLQINDAPAPVQNLVIPYVYNGADLTTDYNYFFKTTPITDCAVLDCFYYGDGTSDCSGTTQYASTTNIQPDNSGTSPFVLTYQQSFMNGYGPGLICIKCRATNDYFDTYSFSI